jgi:FG-GAP repeat
MIFRHRASRGLLLTSLAILVEVPAAALDSAASRKAGAIDVLRQANITRIDGAHAGDRAGSSVAGVGDVNGDGQIDVLVGAEGADDNGRSESGSVYVVFGQASTTTIDLGALGARGFRIDGAAAGDRAGSAVAVAGDVNGDGRADVLVGAGGADDNGRSESGSVYVVFGKTDTSSVDLAALGARGFRIDGAAAGDRAGFSVAGAGDLNGDGRADVLVGAEGADDAGRTDSGSAYLIFGKPDTSSVDLAALGARGFRIEGAAAGDRAGFSVAGAGDMNGDERVDLLVGAAGADHNGRTDSGTAYVVFGQSSATTIDLGALGGRGFRIDGAAADDRAGVSVAAAGDVNEDRHLDLLVGAFSAGHIDRDDSGSAYLVFGKTDPSSVDLAALGVRGFRVDGGTPSSIRRSARTGLPGSAMAGVGDVNGDGRADLLFGAPFASNTAHSSGSAYLVFGKTDTSNVDLVALGARGFRIDGAADAHFAGNSVAGAGDVNSDGRADVLVGATGADHNGRLDSGSAYLVFGKTDTTSVDLGARIDTTPPRLKLGGPESQRVLRQKAVIVTASCNEACTLRASGTVFVAQSAKFLVRPAFSTLAAPGWRTLKLSLTASALAQLERALRRGKRGTANVVVRAVDRAGNAKWATRSLRLIR